jgi:protein TonB
MKTEYILKADLLDIIFENRNKDYGAYPLRKYYYERLYKSLGIIFFLISLFSVFIVRYKTNVILKVPYVIKDIYLPNPAPPKEKITPVIPEKPNKPIPQKHSNTQLFTSFIKIVDSTERSTKLSKNLDSAVISNVTNEILNNTKQIVKTFPVQESKRDNTNDVIKLIDKNKPVQNAEIMPTYPGGMDKLVNFLKNNLHNPDNVSENEIVSVKIKFIVGYDGVLKGFETIEDGGVAFNNEVIRVLKKMPAWIPGKTAGENVSVYYTIPVKFVQQ